MRVYFVVSQMFYTRIGCTGFAGPRKPFMSIDFTKPLPKVVAYFTGWNSKIIAQKVP